jgi:hypothetical protein
MSAFGRFLARPTTGEFLRRALAEDRAQASAESLRSACLVCGFSVGEHWTPDGHKLTCDQLLSQRIKALAQVCLRLSQVAEQGGHPCDSEGM